MSACPDISLLVFVQYFYQVGTRTERIAWIVFVINNRALTAEAIDATAFGADP